MALIENSAGKIFLQNYVTGTFIVLCFLYYTDNSLIQMKLKKCRRLLPNIQKVNQLNECQV